MARLLEDENIEIEESGRSPADTAQFPTLEDKGVVDLDALAEEENQREPFFGYREKERADFEIKAREQAYQDEMAPGS